MKRRVTEDESRPLMEFDGQWISFSHEEKSLPFDVILFRWGRGGFCLGLFLLDPLCMALDEFLDVEGGHPQRGTDGQTAVTLDDERHRFAPGMDEIVDGDGHGRKNHGVGVQVFAQLQGAIKQKQPQLLNGGLIPLSNCVGI